MSCEWMRVVPCNPPVCLTIPQIALPTTLNRKTEGLVGRVEERLCPSLITASGLIPDWASHAYRTTYPGGATLTALPKISTFETWINYVNISTMEDGSGSSYAMDLKETCLGQRCPYDFLRSVSYTMSDVIVISTDSLEEAIDQYVKWLHSCAKVIASLSTYGSILRRHTKPFMVLNIINHFRKEDLKDFLETVHSQNSTNFSDAKTLRDLSENVFQDIIVLDQLKDIDEEILHLVFTTRQKRTVNRHLWSQYSFHVLHTYVIDRLVDPDNSTINFVEALNSLLPIHHAKEQLWSELIGRAQSIKDFEEFIFPLLSRCIARYFLKCCHGKHVPNPPVKVELITTSVSRRRDFRIGL
jgi:hypothetical protein